MSLEAWSSSFEREKRALTRLEQADQLEGKEGETPRKERREGWERYLAIVL